MGKGFFRFWKNQEEERGRETEESPAKIRHICVAPDNGLEVYIATAMGVYKSDDSGTTWEAMSRDGLLSQDVRCILATGKSRVYAVTRSGVFAYAGERWQEISLGLVCGDISFLAHDGSGGLYAACDKGLFKASEKNIAGDTQNSSGVFSAECEPKIREVQEAAIRYAEVQPEKIAAWRRQAAKKPLPQGCGLNDTMTTVLGRRLVQNSDGDGLKRGRIRRLGCCLPPGPGSLSGTKTDLNHVRSEAYGGAARFHPG
jgi:hypothetical protein